MNEAYNPGDFVTIHANARVMEVLADGTLLVAVQSKDYPEDFYDRGRLVRVWTAQIGPREDSRSIL